MPKIMLDEFHLCFFISDRLKPNESRAMRRVINSNQFQKGLLRTLRAHCRRYPALAKVAIKVAA